MYTLVLYGPLDTNGKLTVATVIPGFISELAATNAGDYFEHAYSVIHLSDGKVT